MSIATRHFAGRQLTPLEMRITWIAVLAPLPYSLQRLIWAAGIPLGIHPDGLHDFLQSPGLGSLGLLGMVLLCEGTAAFTYLFLLAERRTLGGMRVRPWLVIPPLLAPVGILATFNHWSLQYIFAGFTMPGEVAEGIPGTLLAGHCDPSAPTRPADRPNLTRMLFLDPHTRDLYADWDEEAARNVATLRLIAGRFPDDRDLAELIGELTVKSEAFAALWAKHPVANCVYGTKRLRHPEVGALTLTFEALDVPDGSGQRVVTYTAEPGSASAAALALLHQPA